MRRVLVASLLLAALPAAVLAIPGTPDRVPAASLLVPYFQTGVVATAHPNDTLLAINNAFGGDQLVHLQVWDIDGNAVALSQNVVIPGLSTYSLAMRDLINSASAGVKAALALGDFYYGFITIDAVTATTGMNPLQGGYPFSPNNVLEGYIYYTRLSEGSANGLAMVPLERVDPSIDGLLVDFYPAGGSREEIDANARRCVDQLAKGTSPCTGDGNDVIDRIHFRQFGSAPTALNGTTRVVLFTWDTFKTGMGPSVICDDPMASCANEYPFKVYRPDGTLASDITKRLDHVVNWFDIVGPSSAWVSIWNVPDIGNDLQVYGFAFNSANPPDGVSQSWDAIFEAYILP